MDHLTTDEDLLQKLTKWFLHATTASIADARRLMKRLKSTDVKIQDPEALEANTMGGKHIRSLGGKHIGNYFLSAKDIPAPPELAMGDAFVGSNDLLLNSMVAPHGMIGTTQKCYDWSGLPTINAATLSTIFGVVVSAIKDDHWNHIYEIHKAGRKQSMKDLDQLRQDTLRRVGSTSTDGLPEMLQDIRSSNEPARIHGYDSSSSSDKPPPVYIRASQAPVRSTLPLHIDSRQILINKLVDNEYWTGDVHDV